MAKITESQLQEWYQSFKKALYEGVNIDVTRKEDLVRVRNYTIKELNINNIEYPDSELQYACIPKGKKGYKVPEPDLMDDPNGHFNWVYENQNNEPTIEEIRQLYELSQKGVLVVYGPTDTILNPRQVQTVDGKVVLSLSMDTYIANEKREDAPESEKMPMYPLYHPVPKKPREMPKMPKEQPVPPDTKPGFWSKVGAFFGFNTDYAKIVRYEKYQQERAEYERKIQLPECVEYLRKLELRAQYERELEEYLHSPLAMMDIGNKGVNNKMTNRFFAKKSDDEEERIEQLAELEGKENEKLLNLHRRTPQGKLLRAKESVQEELDLVKRTKEAMRCLLGPNPAEMEEYIHDRVYRGKEDFDPQPYQVVKKPKNPVLAQNKVNMNELAELACYAAMADPDVAGDPTFEGFDKKESARLRFTHLMDDVIARGRVSSAPYFKFLIPAREAGANAVNEYADGNVQPFAKMLGRVIVEMNSQLTSNSCESVVGRNSYYVMEKLLEVLDRDPALKEASGLTEDQLVEARAGVAYYNLRLEGMKAKIKIVEHSLYQRQMTPEELREATAKVLFMEVVEGEYQAENETWGRELEEKPESIEYNDLIQQIPMESTRREELLKQGKENNPALEQFEQECAERKKRYDYLTLKKNLLNAERPASAIRGKLLDQKWVNASMDMIRNNRVMNDIVNQDREEIGRTITMGRSLIKQYAPTKEISLAKAYKKEDILRDLVGEGKKASVQVFHG